MFKKYKIQSFYFIFLLEYGYCLAIIVYFINFLVKRYIVKNHQYQRSFNFFMGELIILILLIINLFVFKEIIYLILYI